MKTGSFFHSALASFRSETVLILLVTSAFFCPTWQAIAANDNTKEDKTSIIEDEYIIGPADMLKIHVWREPDPSRKIPVRPYGKITLPLLDDIEYGPSLELECWLTRRHSLLPGYSWNRIDYEDEEPPNQFDEIGFGYQRSPHC